MPDGSATSLYADRVKVYPARVRGPFRNAKWAFLAVALAIYWGLPWLRWDRGPGATSQFLLIDLDGRRGYLGPIEIWPQEIYFVTGLLILAAIALFLVTSLFGRVWCGYACPQTVWTDLYMWVERRIEGDRNARMRFDAAPRTSGWYARKTLKHAIWLAIAAATGGAFVLYFGDAPTMLVEIFTGQASTTTYFSIGLLTATTYLLAGMAREQVCTYMCPWPRFQAAMLDEQSLIVTYRAWRGEPRAKHKQTDSWDGRGDCVDCRQCVNVCPTGIDIRDGQQLECIGCGLCIDACDAIMDKVGRPRGLIGLDTLANTEACEHAAIAAPPGPARQLAGQAVHVPMRLIRPRTLIYAGVLAAVCLVMLVALLLRDTVGLNVLRDRAPLYVQLSEGGIRNAYTVKVLNKAHAASAFTLSVEGLAGARMVAIGVAEPTAPSDTVALTGRPDGVASWRVTVTAPSAPPAAQTPIAFVLRDTAGRSVARYDSVFVGPGR